MSAVSTLSTATTYRYEVRDRTGKLVRGRVEADSPAAVVAKLRSMGYAPLSVTVSSHTRFDREVSLSLLSRSLRREQVGLKDLAVTFRQFATMVDAGLSLLRALSILVEQAPNRRLAAVLGTVRGDVEAGTSLSAALGRHPAVFPALVVNLVRAGEVGGFLDRVLLQVAADAEAEVRLRSKVRSALAYPAVVLVLSLLAVTGMLVFVVPVFASMYDGLGAPLPAPTRLLVLLSGSMEVLAPLALVLGVAGALGWRRVKDREQVRHAVDRAKLRLPVFGPLLVKVGLSRFARNLATMISAGVPLLQALDVVAATTGSTVLSRAVRDVQDSVRQGASLAAPLAAHPVFPAMVVQMMAVGEDTGALDTLLAKVAQFYDQEVETTAESLTSLLEPLMVAFLGGLVGAMIVALYLPILTVFQHIQ